MTQRVIVPTQQQLPDAIGAYSSSTPGGLPYPESTDQLNQGANAIKALALALEARGGSLLVQSGKVQRTFSLGNTSPIVFPTAFKSGTEPQILGGCIYGTATQPPTAMIIILPQTATSTQAQLVAYGIGDVNAWFTGTCWMTWMAIGTAP